MIRANFAKQFTPKGNQSDKRTPDKSVPTNPKEFEKTKPILK